MTVRGVSGIHENNIHNPEVCIDRKPKDERRQYCSCYAIILVS